MKSLPNILTISRIIIIPLLVFSFYFFDSKWAHIISATFFAYAGITDFLDGYLARALSVQSKLGEFLDPIADKLLVGSVIVMLVNYGKVDLFPAIIIICREILVSGLREFLAELRVSVPVSNMAKVKTAVQMASIFMLLLGNDASGFAYTEVLGRITIWIAMILTVITGYAYFKAAMKHLIEEK